MTPPGPPYFLRRPGISKKLCLINTHHPFDQRRRSAGWSRPGCLAVVSVSVEVIGSLGQKPGREARDEGLKLNLEKYYRKDWNEKD